MKIKSILFILALLLIGILLAGCGGNSQPVINTLIPSLTSSLTATPAPTLTPSPAPSLTPSLTEPSTMTSTPSVTPLPLVITDPITNTVGHSMSLIPAGEFQMGSIDGDDHESPVHTVNLDAFYIDQTEVTISQYAACMQAGVCDDPNAYKFNDLAYAQYPVNNVSWIDANTYCEWRGTRLPTEAEWEKAARGGLDGMSYPWGNDAPVCDLGASNGAQFTNCSEPKLEQSIAVGMFGSNGYGIYDMAGNVLEWVNDWYQSDYYSVYPAGDWAANPQGPEDGTNKVLRGGSYFAYPYRLTVSYRNELHPGESFINIGFRCAVSAP